MDEILALFPDDKPVLINFYDAGTESAIKDDIFKAKTMLEDRAKLVSIKQQDYPDIAKLWDAAEKSPSMILFKDGSPVFRLYEVCHVVRNMEFIPVRFVKFVATVPILRSSQLLTLNRFLFCLKKTTDYLDIVTRIGKYCNES